MNCFNRILFFNISIPDLRLLDSNYDKCNLILMFFHWSHSLFKPINYFTYFWKFNRCMFLSYASSCMRERATQCLSPEAMPYMYSCFGIFPKLLSIVFFLMKFYQKFVLYTLSNLRFVNIYLNSRFSFVTIQPVWGLPHFISCWYVLGKCKVIYYSIGLSNTYFRRQIQCYQNKGKHSILRCQTEIEFAPCCGLFWS